MMSRLVLWTLLFTSHILSYVSVRSLPSPQLYNVSRIFLRFVDNGTVGGERIVTWNSKKNEGSSFLTKSGKTSAVFYSVDIREKSVMDDWPTGTCKTMKSTDRNSEHPVENLLFNRKTFGLLQLLSGDRSLSVKSCKKTDVIDQCLDRYVCELGTLKNSAVVTVSHCNGKVWQAIVPRKDVKGNILMIKYSILENIQNWNDDDWLSAAAYGNSKTAIETYLVTPSGIFCEGRTMRRHVLPKLPNYFSMHVEEIHAHEPDLIKTSFKVFDYKNRLVREDFVPDSKHHVDLYKKFGGGLLRIVEDFTIGSRFVMDDRLGNCTIIPLDMGIFSTPAQHGHLRMKYSYELFNYKSDSCWQYSGRVHIRGHSADRFICQKKLGTLTGTSSATMDIIELYFSTKKSPTLMLLRHMQTPIDRTLKKEYLDYSWHVIDFRTVENDHTLDLFDVSPCYLRFSIDRVDYFAILEANFKQIIHQPGIHSAIRNALAKGSNLPPHRITRIRIDSQIDNNYVIIWFSFLGLPPPAKRNDEYIVTDTVTIKDAFSLLKSMVDKDLVKIEANGTKYRFIPSTLSSLPKAARPTVPARYTGGNMAAIALSMLGVGILGTAMTIFCIQRRRRYTATAYYVKT